MIWSVWLVALCTLCAGGLIALASTGGGGGAKPRLEDIAARLAPAGSSVLVTGYVRGARDLWARYGRDCRALNLVPRRAKPLRLRLRVHGASPRARRCRARLSRLPVRPTGVRPGSGRHGRVGVIACAGTSCAQRWVVVREAPASSAAPGGTGGRSGGGGPQTGGEVTVAPGVSVPVPTSVPPVPPSVPASLFVAPDGSDSGACSAADPCRSFDRVYQVAQPGQVVEVAGGEYPTQRIEYDPSKTSAADVYFRPAAGAAVRVVGDIDVYGSHVTLMAMRVRDTEVPYDGPAPVRDVTFWALDGRNFTIDSGIKIGVIGGDYGPASDCGGPYGGGNNGIRMNRPDTVPREILIWGVDIHDVQSEDLEQCHIECLIVGAGEGITIRGSRFWNCSIFDVFLQPFNGPISGVTLENNWFAAPTDQEGQVNSARAVEFSGGEPWEDVLIRNNSVDTAINLNDGTPDPRFVNTRVIGNIAAGSGCYEGVTYLYNVWDEGGCGPTDRSLGGAPFPFVRASNHADLDYHLTGGVAVDLVPASVDDLSEDIDGDPRPRGPALDAGADER